MPAKTPLKLDLLRHAFEVIDGIPNHLVTLERWCDEDGDIKTTADTYACVPVWLMRHPDFQVPGFELAQSAADFSTYVAKSKDLEIPFETCAAADYLGALFGLHWLEVAHLFGERGMSEFDEGFEGSDKALWEHRIRAFLAQRLPQPEAMAA